MLLSSSELSPGSPIAREDATTWLEDGVGIRRVPIEAPWGWLAAGWRDLWSAPTVGLVYGIIFTAAIYALALGLLRVGWLSIIPVLAGGLLLIGPMLAVGLYEASRRLEEGLEIDPRDIMMVGVRSPKQLMMMGALLLGLFLVWLEVALLLFMLFLGDRPVPDPEQFATGLLFTPRGLGLATSGVAAGFVLALFDFAATAVSVPLLLVRVTDIVTALRISFAAVRRNEAAMALWAALIAALMALGFASLGLGLIIVFLLIGHATWHAFRDLVELRAEAKIVPDILSR